MKKKKRSAYIVHAVLGIWCTMYVIQLFLVFVAVFLFDFLQLVLLFFVGGYFHVHHACRVFQTVN